MLIVKQECVRNKTAGISVSHSREHQKSIEKIHAAAHFVLFCFGVSNSQQDETITNICTINFYLPRT